MKGGGEEEGERERERAGRVRLHYSLGHVECRAFEPERVHCRKRSVTQKYSLLSRKHILKHIFFKPWMCVFYCKLLKKSGI